RLDGGGGVTAVVTWGVWFGDDGEGDDGDVGIEMMMMWCVAAMVVAMVLVLRGGDEGVSGGMEMMTAAM
ncbi:hypothetical protein Tco_1565694, partial [Tanacetum coccineum]